MVVVIHHQPWQCNMISSKYQKTIEIFTAIGEAFEDCLILVDMNRPGRLCIYVNSVFFKTTGYTREETIGKNLSFLQGPETSQETIIFMREAFEAKASFCVDLMNYRKDGERFLNRLVILPFRMYGLEFMIGFQNEVPTPLGFDVEGDGVLPVSSGEINHMINSPLVAILMNLEVERRMGNATGKALQACRDAFHQINVFCRHIDEPKRFVGYNPFRS